MRTLVVGAGAVGGYFGGRMVAAGRDVTFLVRPGREAVLARDGLRIRSRFGDVEIRHPSLATASDLSDVYDIVMLSCKAYDLAAAMDDFAAAIGPASAILPLLNGMRHLDILSERFGPDRVLGGTCAIASKVSDAGEIMHLNDIHSMTFGERDGAQSARTEAIARLMEGVRFDARASETILQDMWEKWVFLAALAGATCLMRAAIGDILGAPGGGEFIRALAEECRAIAAGQAYAPRPEPWTRAMGLLTAAGSPFTASMLRDIERGGPIEADHIMGDLLARANGIETPHLRLVYAHLKAYESRRARA